MFILESCILFEYRARNFIFWKGLVIPQIKTMLRPLSNVSNLDSNILASLSTRPRSDIGKDFDYTRYSSLSSHSRVVKQLSSTHPIFCWLLKSKHSLIRREHHSLNAHRNIHPTPLISFQNPVAYAIYWAVSEVLSNFSSWFSKPVSKKGKNLIHCLSIDWVLFLSPFWVWTGRKYLPSHGQRTE